MAQYEFWLTDDSGTRITLLKDYFYASYSRSVIGKGQFQIGLSYRALRASMNPVFQPDWRVECWRSPVKGVPMRLERSYILREPIISTRESDDLDVLVLYGDDAKALLGRRTIVQAVGTSYEKKSGAIDDLMKQIVRDQMLYGSCVNENSVADNSRALPTGEFLVEANTTLGPTYSLSMNGKNVLDVLKELYDASIQLNLDLSTNRKIYFDVVETQLSGSSAFGFTFRTYADRRGSDRTQGIVFSVENENMRAPQYSKSYFEEVNAVYANGKSGVILVTDANRILASRWNRSEKFLQAAAQGDATAQQNAARKELGAGIPKEEMDVTILNNPGLNNPSGGKTPRSLYGVDWDLGDLLPVSYADMQFDVELQIVYVSVNDQGAEKITGRNKVN